MKDPLVQLAIWTAAWYQHMYDFREQLVGAGPKPAFGSVLLIQVVGHAWHLYIEHDTASSIDIYEPESLGSTDGLIPIYVLYNSLEAIKEWVKDTFCTNMQTWLMSDALFGGDENARPSGVARAESTTPQAS